MDSNKKSYIYQGTGNWNFGSGNVIRPNYTVLLTDTEFEMFSKKLKLVLKKENKNAGQQIENKIEPGTGTGK